MATVIVYSSANCAYCVRAKQLLDSKNIAYQTIRVDESPEDLQTMLQVTGRRSVPQILIDNNAIGGYTELNELNKTGELDTLLS